MSAWKSSDILDFRTYIREAVQDRWCLSQAQLPPVGAVECVVRRQRLTEAYVAIAKSTKTNPAKVVHNGIGLAVPHQEADANEDEACLLDSVSPAPTETGASKEQRLNR